MCGATARQHRNWLVRLTRSTRSHSWIGYSTVGTFWPAMPALFTSTSILPSSFSACLSASSTEAGSDTSTLGVPSRSQICTRAPELRSRSTMAAPMPCAPPVTTAVRPAKSSWFTVTRSIIAALMAGRLQGKVAFVTAAAQGMGRAAALAFAREGARVWATDVNEHALSSLKGDAVKTRVLDVTDEAAVARVAREAGDIDVLFNCAGIVHHGTILDTTPKDWDLAFAVNVKSMFLVSRAFIPGMLKKGRGSIINMASVASSIR